ncbi:MAG: alpha/beta hydrolase, partial [SAR324 cluster bacterium]|nr:alpha/beta hydrolase [SAR324 cluster bacterium]
AGPTSTAASSDDSPDDNRGGPHIVEVNIHVNGILRKDIVPDIIEQIDGITQSSVGKFGTQGLVRNAYAELSAAFTSSVPTQTTYMRYRINEAPLYMDYLFFRDLRLNDPVDLERRFTTYMWRGVEFPIEEKWQLAVNLAPEASTSRNFYRDNADEILAEEFSEDEALAILDGLKIEKAHICGLSMGSYTSLLFGLKYPERAISLIVAGSGYGSGKERGDWYTFLDKYADSFLQEGMNDMTAAHYASGHTRVQLQNKDPRGFEEYQRQFFQHSPLGSANTFRGVQKNRPNLLDLEDQLRKLTIPTLLMLGDEDDPGLEATLFMKQVIPTAGLEIFPQTGHAINLEEPDRFNRSVLDFLTAAESGRWTARDPRSIAG